MPDIYLLSIGINQYQSDRIPNLGACKKDVNNLQQTLIELDLVKRQNCRMLCDQEASRIRILTAFRDHFSQLQKGDIALLHYSGHGSTEPTDAAFIKAGYEAPGGKNETLVCHDSQTPGVYNIADKELRWLIAELQKNTPRSTFVGLFDCCHSGSMLKEDTCQVRHTSSHPFQRPLAAYLEGQYQQMLGAKGKILLPEINYLSLSACSPKEKAYESREGGFLTNALIQVLRQNDSKLSYAELHYLVSLQVAQKNSNPQHPYLEYWGKANPYQQFLKSSLSTISSMPPLNLQNQNWVVKAGALQGIGIPNEAARTFPIFKANALQSPIGYAQIKKVFVEETIVSPIWKQVVPSENEQLYIGLYQQAIGLQLEVQAQAIHTEAELKNVLNSPAHQNQFFLCNQAKYLLVSAENQLLLYQKNNTTRKLLIGLEEESQQALDWLNHYLQVIKKWENILRLHSPKRSSIALEDVAFFFSYWTSDQQKKTIKVGDDAIASTSVQELQLTFEPQQGPISYQITIKHSHRNLKLFCYLIHLDRRYNICQKYEQYSKAIIRGAQVTLYDSYQKGFGLGISDTGPTEVEDHFILIASEQELQSPYSFHQIGFDQQLGQIVDLNSFQKTKDELVLGNSLSSNWLVKKLTIRLVQKNN